MKLNKGLVCCFSLSFLYVSLTGCVSHSVKPLANNYEEVTCTRTSWEPPAQRFELRYKKKWGAIVVWPDTYGIHIKNDVAVFKGYKTSDRLSPTSARTTEPRLFAVKAPELPLDITIEVLWQWSIESKGDFWKTVKTASIVDIEEKDNTLIFHFAGGGPDSNLNWDQISDIMREVKEKGVEHKDRVWGTSYIEKEFKPETQK
jgi:hypothetical protein